MLEEERARSEGGALVETYIILGSYTQEGMANIKDSPARIDAARKAVEAAGGKFVAWYLTMGRFDFLAITQASNAKVAARVLLAIGGQGSIRTETLRALTEEEFREVVAGLP
jgi:uncharacterized protein with GYD domain